MQVGKLYVWAPSWVKITMLTVDLRARARQMERCKYTTVIGAVAEGGRRSSARQAAQREARAAATNAKRRMVAYNKRRLLEDGETRDATRRTVRVRLTEGEAD